jgi:hypothetical protein
MTLIDTDTVLVALNVPPGLEESVVDWLLGREGARGFMSSHVHGHSSRHGDYSTIEQVSGRRRRVQFEIHMPAAELPAFLRQAAGEFGNADVHCTVVPLMAAGQLRSVVEEMGSG